MRRIGARIVATAQDRPRAVTSLLLVGVATHAVVAIIWPAASPWASYARPTPDDTGTIASVYLGLAGVAALAAGFAGVVIIFGLDTQSRRFLGFRHQSESSLRQNWTAVIGGSFWAAALGVAAGALVVGRGSVVAPWLFELGCLMAIHAAVRMVWLLRILMRLVAEEDREAVQISRQVKLGDILD